MIQILLLVDRGIRGATIGALAIASLLLFLMAVFGAADVAQTNLFGQSIPIVSELSADALAVVIFLAIAYAQQQQQHVSVNLITDLFSVKTRRALQFISLLVTLGFFAVLAWRTWTLAYESWQLKQTAMALFPYPVYPFKIAVFVGTLLATLEAARQIVRRLTGASEQVRQSDGIVV